jgi:hypothetical protein
MSMFNSTKQNVVVGKCPACDFEVVAECVIETTPVSEVSEDKVVVIHGKVVGAKVYAHDCVPSTPRGRQKPAFKGDDE